MAKKIENKTNFEGLRIFGVWDTKLSNGDFVAPHSHRDVEEICYIINGTGHIVLNKKQQAVKRGDLIYVPPKTRHKITHTGKHPLRIITFSVSIPDKSKKNKDKYIS